MCNEAAPSHLQSHPLESHVILPRRSVGWAMHNRIGGFSDVGGGEKLHLHILFGINRGGLCIRLHECTEKVWLLERKILDGDVVGVILCVPSQAMLLCQREINEFINRVLC